MKLMTLDGTGHTIVPEEEQEAVYRQEIDRGLQPFDTTDPDGAVALHDAELPRTRTVKGEDGTEQVIPVEEITLVPRLAGG